MPFVNYQMQTISFNTANTFQGLGTVSIYMLVYFGQLALAIILKMFIKVTGEKYINKQLYKRLIKGLLFNSILSITMESFLE